METCPLTRQACEDESTCRFVIKLEDYEGCPFDLAGKAIQDFKMNTVLPLAQKADQWVSRYLKGEK